MFSAMSCPVTPDVALLSTSPGATFAVEVSSSFDEAAEDSLDFFAVVGGGSRGSGGLWEVTEVARSELLEQAESGNDPSPSLFTSGLLDAVLAAERSSPMCVSCGELPECEVTASFTSVDDVDIPENENNLQLTAIQTFQVGLHPVLEFK
jgi:hypothetical protein